MADEDEPYTFEISQHDGRIVMTLETSEGVWSFTTAAGALSGDAGPHGPDFDHRRRSKPRRAKRRDE